MQHRTDVEAADALRDTYKHILSEIGKVIIGQDEVVKSVLISIFSNGHCLLVGVPGLAKTLLVQTVARVLDLDFNRIQFTPDLMPSDIIGSEILGEDRNFKFIPGPVFSNIILADEINYGYGSLTNLEVHNVEKYEFTKTVRLSSSMM